MWATFLAAAGAASCGDPERSPRQPVPDSHAVQAEPEVDVVLEGDKASVSVLGSDALRRQVASERLANSGSERGRAFLEEQVDGEISEADQPDVWTRFDALADDSLTVGFPVSMIGQTFLFGAVITGVSARQSEALGSLKLSDLTPFHVTTKLAKDSDSGDYFVALIGCSESCNADSEGNNILGLPVIAVDDQAEVLYLDLKVLGAHLNLVEIMDPHGFYTGLKTDSSATTAVELDSSGILLFDIDSKMIPVDEQIADPAPATTFATRWFLKPTALENPSFKRRPLTTGVGFFTTSRGEQSLITRWAHRSDGRSEPIHYFLKGVPEEFKGDFAQAFEDWNQTFVETLGQDLLTWSFIDRDDDLYHRVMTGDIRYNVIEWDTVNKAPYGGFGPSIAHQLTGEIQAANVLVQGPTIIKIFKGWFDAIEERNALLAEGDFRAAAEVMEQFRRGREAPKRKVKWKLALSRRMAFRIGSQMPEYLDHAFSRRSFDAIPEGETYRSYMSGYWRDLVAHELGHNLGMRHNFKGSLGASTDSSGQVVSRSIMEYLGVRERYLNRIGDYDKMAIAYGYMGVQPTHRDWFCTDQDDVFSNPREHSPECTSRDGSADPFSFYKGRLEQAVSHLLGNDGETPEWLYADLKGHASTALGGMGVFIASAPKTFSQWTQWRSQDPTRPSRASDVKSYVVKQARSVLCHPRIKNAHDAKSNSTAKRRVRENMTALREAAHELFSETLGVVDETGFDCQ